jgi:predicted phage terminase large subunit-like protein
MSGKGYHVGIIDDPLNSMKDASSATIRQNQKDWFSSVWDARGEPNYAQIHVQTRWHLDDLAGWLLKMEQEDDELAEHWHILNFPAIYEPEYNYNFPENCTVEYDWREAGEALCEERASLIRLKKKRRLSGSYTWSAVYQQTPIAKSAGYFKRAWLGTVESSVTDLMKFDAVVRYWDKAATEGGDGAETAGVLMGAKIIGAESQAELEQRIDSGEEIPDEEFVYATAEYYVLDVVHDRLSPFKRNELIKDTTRMDAQRFGEVYYAAVEVEGGSGGKESAINTATQLQNIAEVILDKVTGSGSKEQRAQGVSTAWEAGIVKVATGSWNREYIEQHEAFPHGALKDMVDGSSGAYKILRGLM